MTPFGEKVRELRKERGISQKLMAKKLAISPAYLSALEHGHRGRPSWALIQQIISFFNIIWDEAEELENLARISHPKNGGGYVRIKRRSDGACEFIKSRNSRHG